MGSFNEPLKVLTQLVFFTLLKNCTIPGCIKGKVFVISVGALVGVVGLSLGRVQWRAVGKRLRYRLTL